MMEQAEFGRDEAPPIDMLAALFSAREWEWEHVGEDEIAAEVRGSWTTYQLRAIWRREDNVLQLLALPEIVIPAEKRAPVNEALALVNEQMWLGHFDIWSSSHHLLYRHGLMLGSDGLLGLDQAQLAVESAIDEWDRFYPVFQFILWSDRSPAEALAAALIDTEGEA